jgi:hypothetical protein
MAAKLLRSNGHALLTISIVALCVVLPFLHFGIPSGHDFEFHFNSWIEVVDHWRQGNFYPHWDASAHYEYGEARFIFYPPFSWTLGALLGLILPWKLVTGAYIFIVLTLAGWSMFALANRFLPQRDALFAAALYAANPYNLVVVYWRSAFAELMAAIYIPLLFLLILRIDDGNRRAVVPLSLLMAAGWLTNLPSAVMMNYSLGLLALALAIRRRSLAILGYTAVSIVIGALLAAFFLVPAFRQQSWVDIGQVLAPGVRPMDNFLFTRTADADHNTFNLLISIVAVGEIAILALAIARARRSLRQLWPLLLVWSAACILLLVKPTLLLWNHVPELRFVQFPWRWLLCLNVPLALAVASGLQRWWTRALICAVAIGVVAGVWIRVQPPWWDNSGDIQEMLDNQQDGIGNEGIDEYVPAGADTDDIDHNAPLLRYEGRGTASFTIQAWRPEQRAFAVTADAPGNVVLRLFHYPSWKVHEDGKLTQAETLPTTGQMLLRIPAGHSEIRINFVEGWDRTLGIAISIMALGAVLIWWAKTRNITPARQRGS